jgi:hypothetical protein
MILNTFTRPWVKFDVHNSDHRRWYAEFLQMKTWGHCPVRFVMEDEGGANLIGMIQSSMVEYYTNQEFGQLQVDKAA